MGQRRLQKVAQNTQSVKKSHIKGKTRRRHRFSGVATQQTIEKITHTPRRPGVIAYSLARLFTMAARRSVKLRLLALLASSALPTFRSIPFRLAFALHSSPLLGELIKLFCLLKITINA